MKKIICLLLMLLISITIPVQAENLATCTLVPCCDITEGDEFTVTLYIDTDYNTTGFTLRQMTWEADIAALVEVSFKGPWIDEVFNDLGDILTPGNLTYLMSVNLSGVTGYNPAVTFTFTALKHGTLHLNIPDNIWSGQQGLVVDFSDTTSWENIELNIAEDTSGGGNSGGGGTGGGNTNHPPVNEPPVAVIDCPSIGYTNESIIFSAINSTDDGTIVEYIWGFGDNHTGTGRILNHTYIYPGNYTVLLAVTDDKDESTSVYKTIEILQGESWNPNDPPEQNQTSNETNNTQNETNNQTQIDEPEPEEEISIVVYILVGIVALLIIITILRRLKVF